jgi:hypothetical protein
MTGLLLLFVVLALIFGLGTAAHVTLNVLLIVAAVALVLGVLGYAGFRGRGRSY